MRAGQQKKSRLAGGPRELGRQETEAWKTTKSDQQIKPKRGSLTNSKRRIYCPKTEQRGVSSPRKRDPGGHDVRRPRRGRDMSLPLDPRFREDDSLRFEKRARRLLGRLPRGHRRFEPRDLLPTKRDAFGELRRGELVEVFA